MSGASAASPDVPRATGEGNIAHMKRFGLKGPNAASWLQQRGVTIPERANSWYAVHEGDDDIVIRLGHAEFFLEYGDDEKLRAVAAELATPIPGVYPVLREDRAFALGGPAADDVLAQMCNVNFSALRYEREAVMTMMIGVAVVVVSQGNGALRRYRLWCDPSYGDYFESSLRDVVASAAGMATATHGA